MKPLKSIKTTMVVMKAQTKRKIPVMVRKRRAQKRSRARKKLLPLQLPRKTRKPLQQNLQQPPTKRTSPPCPRQKRTWRRNLPSGRTELEVIWQPSMLHFDRRSAMGSVSEKKLILSILLIFTPTNSGCKRLPPPSRRSGTSKKSSRPRKAKRDERWRKAIFSLRCHRPRFSHDSVIFMSGKRRD